MSLLLILFLTSVGLFFGIKSYPAPKNEAKISNEYVISEELPQQVSSYIFRVLTTYENRENTGPLTIVEDTFIRADGGYAFYVQGAYQEFEDDDEASEGDYVEVRVDNYAKTYAIEVRINGIVQPIQ